jgi:hypothetical protein
MIEFNDRREKEKIVPLDPAVISRATSSGSDNSAHSKEEFPPAVSGRITAAEIKAVDVVATSPSQDNNTPPPAQGPSPFAWGRWGSQWSGDTMSKPYSEAREGRNITVGNKYFALFRTKSDLAQLEPHAGQYDFKLQQGQVHFVGNGVSWQTVESTVARLDVATLRVDFGQREFNTHLEMSHPLAGSAVLDERGKIENNGIFRAGDFLNGSGVAGALSMDGAYAGMAFKQVVRAGAFQGETDWARK